MILHFYYIIISSKFGFFVHFNILILALLCDGSIKIFTRWVPEKI